MINLHTRIQGEIRAILLNAITEAIEYDSGWFPNLLTNQGLINMFESSWADNFNVGTDSTAPAFTNANLGGWLADSFASHIISTLGVAPNWEFSTTKKARFAAGVATAVLTEVGMNKHTYTNNTKMSIRALLSPPVDKAADQILDLYYKLTRWPDIVDRTGVVEIKGENYNYIVRGANYGTGQTGVGTATTNAFGELGVANSSGNMLMSSNISTIDSEPATALSSPWVDTVTLIANASGYADYRLKWGLDKGNGSIRSILLREAGHGISNNRGWQIRLGKVSDDSPLVKTNEEELILEFHVTWDRL